MFYYSLSCISIMICNAENIYMCLLDICLSSLSSVFSNVLPTLKIGLLVLFFNWRSLNG